QNSLPNGNLWGRLSFNFGLFYFTISASINVILTILIFARIFVFRYHARKALEKAHTVPYMSVAALLIESCVLYAIFSILFIVLYGVQSDLS
ncbi:hypothetical protein SERLA73DRAFT_38888, partial [Serpula lacrymans var. lacrymans S7.3]